MSAYVRDLELETYIFNVHRIPADQSESGQWMVRVFWYKVNVFWDTPSRHVIQAALHGLRMSFESALTPSDNSAFSLNLAVMVSLNSPDSASSGLTRTNSHRGRT